MRRRERFDSQVCVDVDPMVQLTEWAIPNSEVERHKKKMVALYMPIWARFIMALRRVSLIMLVISSVALLFFIKAMQFFSPLEEVSASELYSGLSGLQGIWIISFCAYVWSRMQIFDVAFWKREELWEFGWGNLPRAALAKAKWVQQHFPHATIFVDSIDVDPYLGVELYGRYEYYIDQWG